MTRGLDSHRLQCAARVTYLNRRTLVAYEVEESADGVVVSIYGILQNGQDWESDLDGT